MAAVQCPACGRKVADTQPRCIHCDAPMPGAAAPLADDGDAADDDLGPAPPVIQRGTASASTGPAPLAVERSPRGRGGGARKRRRPAGETFGSAAARRAKNRLIAAAIVLPIVGLLALFGIGGGSLTVFAEESWSLPPGTFEYVKFDGAQKRWRYEIDSSQPVDTYVCAMPPMDFSIAGLAGRDVAKRLQKDPDKGEYHISYLREVSVTGVRRYTSETFKALLLDGLMVINEGARDARVRVTVWAR